MNWQNHGPGLARPEDGDPVTLASDADRDAAVGALNEAFTEGRLTADEHAGRVREAYAALADASAGASETPEVPVA